MTTRVSDITLIFDFKNFNGEIAKAAAASGRTIAQYLDEITQFRNIAISPDFLSELNGGGSEAEIRMWLAGRTLL